MRLRDLDARFINRATATSSYMMDGDSAEGAQGIRFQCPKCGEGKERGEEDGRRFIRGAHFIRVFFANPIGTVVAPPDADNSPRWQMTGSTLDDLTLYPSINCDIPWKDPAGDEHPSSCRFHGWINNGDVA